MTVSLDKGFLTTLAVSWLMKWYCFVAVEMILYPYSIMAVEIELNYGR